MDSSALTMAVLDAAKLTIPADTDRLFAAISAAAFLHRNQTRANRGNLPRTPYIEHPLRGTLRLLRWGVSDADILVASLLHDTIEDCSTDIIRHYMGIDPAGMGTAEQRRYVIEWMSGEFGVAATEIVLAVTNPDFPATLTRTERNALYVDKVAVAIAGCAPVFLVKASDFVDNACGLPHNNVHGNTDMVSRLARKYQPLVPIFQAELLANPNIAALISDDGFASLDGHLAGATDRIQSVL